MEDQVVDQDNGREVGMADINTAGESAALADDRILAELFRMSPFDGSNAVKGVLPYVVNDPSATFALVAPDGAVARGVLVYPHRSLIGTRTDVVADAKRNWRDIRSCVSVGSTDLTQSVVLAANTSGDPRWDLIYEVVAIDTNISDTRFFKNPTSGAVSSGAYVVKKVTTPLLQVVQGTPAPAPTKPSLPSDAGSNYNVPIAYVLVRDGVVGFGEIELVDVAPALVMSTAMGTTSLRPATAVSTLAGASMTALTWFTDGTARPGIWMPPTMVGGVQLLLPVQLGSGLTASFADGDIVDEKIDWRRRFFRWWVHAVGGDNDLIASDPALDVGVANGVPFAGQSTVGQNIVVGMGASFQTGLSGQTPELDVLLVSGTQMTALGAASQFGLYVEKSTGKLRILIGGAVNAQLFIWLDATAQFPNPATPP